MKKLLFSLCMLCMLSLCSVVRAQCANDTLVSGISNYTSTRGLSTLCGTQCEVDQQYNWQFPPNWGGYMNISNSSAAFADVIVRIVVDCRFVLFDSCMSLSDPIIQSWTFLGVLPANSQLFIFWNSAQTDSINTFIKTDPVQTNILTDTVMDMDTCGGPLMSVKPSKAKRAIRYFHPITLREVENRLPNVGYLIK